MTIEQTEFQPGVTGELITNLHRRLELAGIAVSADERVDDHFGPGTEEAVRRFQAVHGLPGHGVVDPVTARGLGLGGFPTSVTGVVCHPDGRALANVAVQLVQPGAGGDEQVGETRSGSDGKFSLPWPRGRTGGLVVRAEGGVEKALSWKAAVSAGTLWVRLSVGGAYRGAPRFALIDGEAAAASAASGRDAPAHALARALAARTKLDPEVVFALLTTEVGHDVDAAAASDDRRLDALVDRLLSRRRDDLRASLAAAVADNVVGALDVDAAADRLHALRIEHIAARPLRGRIFGALAAQHACCASSPDIPRDAGAATAAGAMHAAAPLQVDDTALRDLIATSVTDPAAQRRVLEAFAAHEADADLQRIVDAADLPAAQRADLLFTLETAALVGNHLPLVARVQKLRAAKAVATTADLARLDEADWTKLLHEADPGAARIALPTAAGLAAAASGDRIAYLARAVARRFAISHPTTALSGRLAKDAGGVRLAGGKAVQRFLDRAPGFCIRHTHIDRFVNEAAADVLPSGDERTQLVADLKTLQRAYKLTPRADHVKAMLAAGHNSAYSVYSAGPQQFAAQMTAGGATPDEATAMFAQAEQVHATALTLMANLNSAFTGATPLAVAQPITTAAVQAAVASFPNLLSLFGPIDYCACADCRAIHGPAAYLVDLLQFLNSRKTAAGATSSLRDILIGHATDILGRRPDLAQIELSCANTNGIVPYIDLVCEILEDAVAAPASGVVRARQTSGSDAERRANPAFVNDSAYSTLRAASFPISAPFDLYAAEIRAFFRQIGVAWHEMMTALQMPASGSTPPAPTSAQIAGERFGFSASALSIVTTASPASPWTLWNLASSNNTVPDPRNPNITKTGSWLQVLSYVPILLNRAMLQHRELIQLLQTRFCNPNGVLAIVETASGTGFATCDLGQQSIKLASGASGDAWTADLLTRFNRFIRLWRQLGCTIWDLDKLICTPAIGNTAIDDNAIAQLGLIDVIAARLPGPRDELLALWGDIDHFDYLNVLGDPEVVVPSVYKRRFRNTTVTQASTAFPDDPNALTGTLDDAAAVAGIAAALDISAADIAQIRAAAALSAAGTALNLGNLSAIARYAILADRLAMSIADLVTAIGVTGVNPFPSPLSPAATLQFLTALDQVNSSGFTLNELNYLLRHGSVVDSRIGLADATIIAWLEDLRRSLVRLASAGPAAAADLVVQRLGAALALDPTLIQQVLQATLPGGSSTIASLFTAAALTAQAADGTFTTATTRANFGAIFDAYTALDKLRLVLARWKVSTADALWLVQHAAAAGWVQLHTLPANATAAQSSTVTLAQLDILRNNIVVQQTLASPAGVRLFDFVLTPGTTVADAAAKLAPLGNWQASDIAGLAAQFRLTTAASLAAGATVARIRDAMAWPRKLGADVPTTLSYVTTAVDSTLSRKARQLAKSKFSNDQWLDVAARIQDGLREQKRAALVGWLLVHPDSSRGQSWVTVEDLYGFYLIDPEMSAVTDTTRVKQATASVQLFVQRCLMQLEANITADPADIGWKQWDWMKRFRLWEANRKIFLYPENWFDPTQRHDTSPYFEDLINDLQQTDLTNDIAEDALRAYLHKLADVAHLEVSGIWEQQVQGTNSILHVVARTRKTPYVYSYRRRESTLSWSPWEPVDAGVDTNPVMPVIWNNRLFLLWTEFTQKSLPTSNTDRTVPPANANPPAVAGAPINYWEIALAWIERRNDLWMPKRLSQRKQLLLDWRRAEIVSRLTLPVNTRSLSVELYEPTRTGATTAVQAQWVLTSAQDEPMLTNAGDFTNLVSLDDRRYFSPSPGTTRGGKPPKLAGNDMSFNLNANGGDNPGATGILALWKPDANGNEVLRNALTITQARVISARFLDQDQFTSPFFISDSQRSFFATDNTWTLQPFYHPFVETFVQQLNIAGIPGLYSRQLQIDPDTVRGTGTFSFTTTYSPTSFVTAPFPAETIDYTQSGPYSVYNWELFLHAPLLIAKKLAANQRFAEALTWFHYIFNPTTVDNGSAPQRYWNPRVFRDLLAADYTAQQIEQLLQQVNAGIGVSPPPSVIQRVTDWRNNPFDPNLVAAARPVAYQKAVVMAYISTLIAWGDQLFRGNTIESINEATQLYLLASQLLGPRPQSLRAIQPRQNKAYTDLSAQLDAFSSSVVDIENVVSVPPPGVAAGTGLPPLHTFYFCIPPNDQMLSFWDTVADRLFKVRHGLDINGVARPLSLFDSPIDPGVLVRAAAAGVDISAAVADTAVNLMCYRFSTLWQVAHDLCQDVRGLGSAILAALERRDGEEMARLRATQEVGVLDAMTAVKTRQRDEAIANRDALQFSHQLAEARRDYYKSREFKNDAEAQGLALAQGAIDLEYTAVHLDILAAVAALLPALSVGASGWGGSPVVTVQFGGEDLSRNCTAAAGVLRGYANIRSQKAGMSNTLASYQRRADEWDFQRQLAETELKQIDKQLAAAELRIAIAEHELDVHLRQVADAQANAELLKTKFTNQELYDWLVSQLSATYFHAYQLAYDLAKRASKAYAFELGRPDPGFIQFGYWDNLHRGLVTGDKLLLDLRRLQTEHLNRNTREFEMTKHISMLQLDPTALIALRQTGTCFFNLPESLFDLDQPGHYYRRLKTVSVTLPCVTGPYTSINATLTLLSHSTRIDPAVGSGYLTSTTDSSDGLPSDARFSHATGAVQQIALSTGREDAGLFEVNFHDDRYLPFEGAGAISHWRLELPADTNQFDLQTLSDVVLHARYTARDGGQPVRDAARAAVVAALPRNGVQVLSARTEFPDAYARLFAPTGSGQSLDLAIGPEHFPFVPTTRQVNIAKMTALLVFAADKTYTDYLNAGSSSRLPAHLGFTNGNGTPPSGTGTFTIDTSKFGGLPSAAVTLSGAAGPLSLAIVESELSGKFLDQVQTAPDGTSHHRLNQDLLEDILIVIDYQIVAKS